MLVEIETDKVILEVPASQDGILDAILEDEGATVTSRQVLGRIRPSDSSGKPTEEKSEYGVNPAQRQTASLEEESNETLSPAIRRLIAEHDLDATAIKGSGVGGRITREDVDSHLASRKSASAVVADAKAVAAAAPVLAGRSEKRVPMSRLRKRVAERLLEAKTAPQC